MGFVTLKIGVLAIELRHSIELILLIDWSISGLFVDNVVFHCADDAQIMVQRHCATYKALGL